MSFRLVPKIGDLEWHNGLILRYFTQFSSYPGAHCVKVVEDVVAS